MIVTLTPNASIDVALTLEHLEVGEVNRATDVRRDPAGKGINVARALCANGVAATAVYPADAVNGTQLTALLSATPVAAHAVPIREPIRQNITILDEQGTTKVNEAGPRLDTAEIAALDRAVSTELEKQPRWLVCAGSLPPGLSADWLVSVGRAARSRNVPFAVDVSGEALRTVVASGVATIIKPNDEELAELLGAPLDTVGDVVDGVRSILRDDAAQALVSLGKNGALLITPSNCWWAGTVAKEAVSTVGAGDSTLAGYLSVDTADLSLRLATGVAWGSAAVTLPGTKMPTPDVIDVASVTVVPDPDPSTKLGELSV